MATDSGDVATLARSTVDENCPTEDNNNKVDLVADTVAKLSINGTSAGEENGDNETETVTGAASVEDDQENQLNNNKGDETIGNNNDTESSGITGPLSIGKRIRRTSEKLNEDVLGGLNSRKKYSLDLLLSLKDSAIGREKPTTIPDVCKSLLKSSPGSFVSSGRHMGGGGSRSGGAGQDNSLLPAFMKGMGFGAPPAAAGGEGLEGGAGMMRPPINRNVYRGRLSAKEMSSRTGGGGPGGDDTDGQMIKVNLNITEEVKLKGSANAWKPRFMMKDTEVDTETETTQELSRQFRSALNKLTPENFAVIMEQIKQLKIDTMERLTNCIKILFEKAIMEPNFSDTYAQLCEQLGTIIQVETTEEGAAVANFKRQLIKQCQEEFENHHKACKKTSTLQVESDKLTEEGTQTAEQKEDMKLELEEQTYRIRRRALGTIRFIGALYKQNQLKAHVMLKCIRILLFETQLDEESLECVCKLLTTIGARIETEAEKEQQATLQECFNKLQSLAERKTLLSDGEPVCNRIRFMIMDLLDLRKDKWRGRHAQAAPKTREQIQREVEAEENKNWLLNYKLPRGGGGGGGGGNRQNYNEGGGGGGGNRGGGGGGGGGGGNNAPKNKRLVDEDGFVNVTNNRNAWTMPSIDPKKINISAIKPPEETRLGSASLYQGWGKTNLFASLNTDESAAPAPSFFGASGPMGGSGGGSGSSSGGGGGAGGAGGGGKGSSSHKKGGGGGGPGAGGGGGGGNNSKKQHYHGRSSSHF